MLYNHVIFTMQLGKLNMPRGKDEEGFSRLCLRNHPSKRLSLLRPSPSIRAYYSCNDNKFVSNWQLIESDELFYLPLHVPAQGRFIK